MSASVLLYFDFNGDCPIFIKFYMNLISLEVPSHLVQDSVVKTVSEKGASALEWKVKGDTWRPASERSSCS
jgi:hypothetical protein